MKHRRGSGEGSIYQREDGRWTGVVNMGYRAGKRKRRYVYAATRKEVADKLKKLHNAQEQGDNIAPDRITVATFLNQWLQEIVKANRRPSTYKSYSGMIRLHVLPHIGHLQVSKVTAVRVQSLLNELQEDLSPRTVQYLRNSILSGAWEVAIKWNYATKNVILQTEAPKVPKYRPQPLTLVQAKALLVVVAGHRLEALYRVALSLGLRKSEILALTWEDVNFDKRSLRVRQSKTEAGVRILALPNVLCEVLRQHQARQHAEQREACWCNGLMFSSEVGTPILQRNLIRHFKSLLRRAGLPERIRFHDLRHSCATFLIAQGVHLKVVSEILGHASIAVTADTYGHVLSETQRAGLGQLDKLFGDEEGEKSGGNS